MSVFSTDQICTITDLLLPHIDDIRSLHTLARVSVLYRAAVVHVIDKSLDYGDPHFKALVGTRCLFRVANINPHECAEIRVAMWCTDHCYKDLFPLNLDPEGDFADVENTQFLSGDSDNSDWAADSDEDAFFDPITAYMEGLEVFPCRPRIDENYGDYNGPIILNRARATRHP